MNWSEPRAATRLLTVLMSPLLILPFATAAGAQGPPGVVRVSVAPISVDPKPFAGTPGRPDAKEFGQRLSEEATKQALRTLTERRIADAVASVPSPAMASGWVVTGIVRLPLSLPPRLIGWDAAHRRGQFASATVTVTDHAGAVLSIQTAVVNWGDVWWFHAGKDPQDYRLDDVLASFARKATDHAVRRLDLRHLAAEDRPVAGGQGPYFLGPPVQGSGVQVQGSGVQVQGSGVQVQGSGVQGLRLSSLTAEKAAASPPGPTSKAGDVTAQVPLPRTFSVPLDRAGNTRIPFVRVALDDGKTYRFALDPGTPNTAIDQTVAAGTGLPLMPHDLPAGGSINTLTSTLVLGSSGLKLSDVPFVVQNLRAYRSLYPGFAGVLGANLLKQLTERLDFSAGNVEFIIPPGTAGAAPDSGAAGAIPVPHVMGDYRISATADGIPTVFLLSTLYDATIVHTAALLSRLKPRATLRGLPAGDGTPVRFLRLGRLSVGGQEWRSPVVEEPLAQGVPATNVLGLDFLRRFRLTLDLGHERVYLDPDPTYREDPHEWEGLGIVPVRTAQGKLVIAALGDPSPARAAGLTVGDELTAIQAVPTARLSQEQELALVKRLVGTPVEITVRAHGTSKLRQVHLKVKNLL